jgi:hypothetical protein
MLILWYPPVEMTAAEKTKAWKLKNPERHRAYMKAYAIKNAAKCSAWTKAWQKRNPEKMEMARKSRAERRALGPIGYRRSIRNARLRRKYGIGVSDYEDMFTAQRGRCAICGKKKVLVVDHDHETGAVRKLLCNTCNGLIGYLESFSGMVTKCFEYIQQHKRGKNVAENCAVLPLWPQLADKDRADTLR